MFEMNMVHLAGYLGADPLLRVTHSARAVAHLTLAINPIYTGDSLCYVPLEVWGRPAEVACQYLVSGDACLVSGRLRSTQWTDAAQQCHERLIVTAGSIEFLPRHRFQAVTSDFTHGAFSAPTSQRSHHGCIA